MNRVVGWELSFTKDFVVIPTVDLEIQLFVGLVIGFLRVARNNSTSHFLWIVRRIGFETKGDCCITFLVCN
ncbi:hypothetical protein ACO1J7_05845 [Leptospira interrogans serovar Australis]|uniref:hypothetical protein n=1 Tax=Leptospira interrogans TaxID=173 RepID=UPI0002DAE6CF